MASTTYHARWIAPVTADPIENGSIVCENGRIISVERGAGGGRFVVDLGDVVVVPGFVNAHTHLELGFCHGRVPCLGSFVAWIQTLTALLVGDHAANEQTLSDSIRNGIQQSLAAGVTAVADISHGNHPIDRWINTPIHTAGFLEVLGMGSRRSVDHKRSVHRAIALCKDVSEADRGSARAEARGSLTRIGLSPHAPYSTDTSVYREAMEFAMRTDRPICTHLAETREEVQFLADGTGPFRELLEMWRLWDGSFVPPACSPVGYAHRIGLLACDPILAHVNYVTDTDLQLLEQCDARIAFCPRTHAFFGHEPHRYRDMNARGINVCIGTDSLASNDTLSVLDELRFLRRCDPTVDALQLLTMGTLAGARALKWHNGIGSLAPGKRADFVAVPLDCRQTDDPIDDLLASNAHPSAVYLSGEQLWPH